MFCKKKKKKIDHAVCLERCLEMSPASVRVFPRASSSASSSSLNIYGHPPLLRPGPPPSCSSNLQHLAPLRSTKPERHWSVQNQPTSSKKKPRVRGCGSQGAEGTKLQKTQSLFIQFHPMAKHHWIPLIRAIQRFLLLLQGQLEIIRIPQIISCVCVVSNHFISFHSFSKKDSTG